jgi:hypothetical protein|nr:MAG TPA: hypothetical protein [Caudoviricetes sp.]DAJ21605.1 MAG TPA: hypothetical protein [Siphoviridae sp. ctFjF5]DAU57457.1 MAG TPA: hypothetical protein [Caudoviricetes sp.]
MWLFNSKDSSDLYKQVEDLKRTNSALEAKLKSKEVALNSAFTENQKMRQDLDNLKMWINEACSVLLTVKKKLNIEE